MGSERALRALLLIGVVACAYLLGRAALRAPASIAGPPESHRVDLNHAPEAEIAALPTLGPTRAREIVAFRKRVGGFAHLGDLEAVRGIGPATLERIRDHVAPLPGEPPHDTEPEARRDAE